MHEPSEHEIAVLLVDDDDEDYLLTKDMLAGCATTRYTLNRVADYAAALGACGAHTYDVCLIDYRLGHHDGIELMRELVAAGHDMPIIMLTGQGDLTVDVEAAHAGAADYLVKGEISPGLLERTIRYAIRSHAAMRELVAARDAALEASRLKSDFVATISHELRTPMNGVVGMTELLLATALDPTQREYAEAIQISAEAQMAVISDILDFSKIAAGKIELDIGDFDVRRTVEEVRSFVAAAAAQKKLELTTSVDLNIPALLRTDGLRVRQILANLVNNAVKFTPAGKVTIDVTTVGPSAAATTLRFQVSDTGIGLPQDATERIFDSFTQADSSTTRTYGGIGLGLAIARQLVDMLGGQIDVASTLGSGSTFSFTIPCTRAQQPINQPAHARTTTTQLASREQVAVGCM